MVASAASALESGVASAASRLESVVASAASRDASTTGTTVPLGSLHAANACTLSRTVPVHVRVPRHVGESRVDGGGLSFVPAEVEERHRDLVRRERPQRGRDERGVGETVEEPTDLGVPEAVLGHGAADGDVLVHLAGASPAPDAPRDVGGAHGEARHDGLVGRGARLARGHARYGPDEHRDDRREPEPAKRRFVFR